MAKLAVFLLLLAGSLHAQSSGDELSVSVRQGELRSAPGFLSSIDARLEYGDAVRVISRVNDWLRVTVDHTDEEGWIHTSSVARPRDMNLTGPGARTTQTTTREIALAGRGFNQQVEQEYQEQMQLDFSVVDRVEENLLALPELADFLSEIGAELLEGGL